MEASSVSGVARSFSSWHPCRMSGLPWGVVMRRRSFFIGASCLFVPCVAGASDRMVGSVEVSKSERSLALMSGGGEVLARFPIRLGFSPVGHKERVGDGRTPEGEYFVTHRNGRSRYHLSLGISYPSRRDKALAAKLGLDPGGDIMIHGQPPRVGRGIIKADWTEGCVALANEHMDRIWRHVPVGCRVVIRA